MNPTIWNRSNADIFWAEIAPSDHVIQIYENDVVFLDALAGFIGGGINANECVIVIATSTHLKELDKRLNSYGIRVDTLVEDDRYIPLDADETLSKFMVNGWPDEDLFIKTFSSIIERGNNKNRRIRAFGEMVAILWARGLNDATVQLEQLWNKFCSKNQFCLFCAYPKSGFIRDNNESINRICSCHTKMIDGSEKQLTEIVYTNLVHKQAV